MGFLWIPAKSLTCDLITVEATPGKEPGKENALWTACGGICWLLLQAYSRCVTSWLIDAVWHFFSLQPCIHHATNYSVNSVAFLRALSRLQTSMCAWNCAIVVLTIRIGVLIAKPLINYLTTSDMLPKFQSAYRSHHSTETAVAKVLSDILLALDEGDLPCLALLDLSAAFDTVDHELLLQRLHITYGVNGVAHDWFRRTWAVAINMQNPSKPVVYGPYALRCTTRIGSRPDLISILHRWHRSIGWESWTTCPPLCWWH